MRGGGLADTLSLSLRTNKVKELLIKTSNAATTVVPYAPDGAQLLSIIGGKAHDGFPGGYAPESELFYYGGGNLIYEGKQYQSIYQAFHKAKVRLLYHGMTSNFNNTAEKERVQNLLLDMMDDNKTLII